MSDADFAGCSLAVVKTSTQCKPRTKVVTVLQLLVHLINIKAR
jgi:hypothetical protein